MTLVKSKYNLREKSKSKKINLPPPPQSDDDDDDDFVTDDCETTTDDGEDSDEFVTDESSDEEFDREEMKKIKNEITDKNGEVNHKKLKNCVSKICGRKSKNSVIDESDEDCDNDNDNNHKRSYTTKKNSNNKKSYATKSTKPTKPTKESDDDDKPEKNKDNKKKNKNKQVKKNAKKYESDDESNTEESDNDSEENSDDENTTEDKDKKLNIIFTIGGAGGGGGLDDEFYDDDDDMVEEDEDECCDSDDEKTFMRENYQEVEEPPTSEGEQTKKSTKNQKHGKHTNKNDKHKKNKDAENEESVENIQKYNATINSDYLELLDLKKNLMLKLHKKPHSVYLKNAVKDCKNAIKTLINDARKHNTKTYKKLVVGDKNKESEIDYFKKKLSNKEQLEIMNDLKEINKHIHIEKPYRLSILQSKMPSSHKSFAIQKLNMLRSMEPGDSEYFKIKNWVDTFMKIPFNVYKDLTVSMTDGIDTCDKFMDDAKQTLDDCVYGLDDAKLQIMQMLGQWISNPTALGSAIAIKGPAGTGKTSLVKNGISKILGREFAFIALGGAGDSSFLEGHSYTYEGSTWGKIVQILIDCKCMNPVIYFDELDKVSDSVRGQEIIGILTHLIDTTQNNQFHDKYFSEIDFDLSKCLFIFSYNDENLVNPILKDRMYRIETKGYDMKEKTIIAKKYLLPKIREQVNFNEGDVIIPDETIQHIIQHMTKSEDGVRNLKRSLEIIHTKLNLFRLVKPENKIFSKHIDIQVEFPFTVTKKHAELLIKSDMNQNHSLLAMYV